VNPGAVQRGGRRRRGDGPRRRPFCPRSPRKAHGSRVYRRRRFCRRRRAFGEEQRSGRCAGRIETRWFNAAHSGIDDFILLGTVNSVTALAWWFCMGLRSHLTATSRLPRRSLMPTRFACRTVRARP